MANKEFWIVTPEGVKTDTVDFEYFTGFATKRRQMSYESMHKAIKEKYPDAKILEVSSVSKEELGRQLSAMNLILKDDISPDGITVEQAYQGAKVFGNGAKLDFTTDPHGAKIKATELAKKYKIDHYERGNTSSDNAHDFYENLYLHGMIQSGLDDVLDECDYTIFTDLFHKPGHACQAEVVAYVMWMLKVVMNEDNLISED